MGMPFTSNSMEQETRRDSLESTRHQVWLNSATEPETEQHHSEFQPLPWPPTEKDTLRIEDQHPTSTLMLCLQSCTTLVSFQSQKPLQWLSTTSPGPNGWRLPRSKSHEMNEKMYYKPKLINFKAYRRAYIVTNQNLNSKSPA